MKCKIVGDVFDTSDNDKTISYVFDTRNKLRNSMRRFWHSCKLWSSKWRILCTLSIIRQ